MDFQRRRLLWLAACAAGLPLTGVARAQAYPAKPVRVFAGQPGTGIPGHPRERHGNLPDQVWHSEFI
jgi:hypothetical protein